MNCATHAVLLAVFGTVSGAFAASPAVFYTDLDSGPNTGGEHDRGAVVSIYGNNFGPERGESTVTIGAGAVASYKSWSNTTIAVQLGPNAATGPVVITVQGAASNRSVIFTVRPGKLYFVATGGSDSAAGTFAQPLATIKKCKNALEPGDICYVLDGVRQTTSDSYNAALAIMSSGLPGRPKAIVAYPGAAVTVGDTALYGIRTPAISGSPFSYWTIAGLHLIGNAALQFRGLGWRVVANDMECPAGNGPSGCVETSAALHAKFLGNEVHHAGCGEDPAFGGVPCAWHQAATTASSSGVKLQLSAFTTGFTVPDRIIVNGQIRIVTACSGTTNCTINEPFSPDLPAGTAWQFRDFAPGKLYHSVYFSSDSVDIEAGWNHVHDNLSCRGIQFHSSPTITANILSASNGSPIVLTTSRGYFISGQRVFVSGVTGNPAANGAFWVKAIDPATWHLYLDRNLAQPAVGNGRGTGGSIADGLNQYDLFVHDNLIHGQTCDGINFATVDPSLGPVGAWNNVIFDVGSGASDGAGHNKLDPPGGFSHYSGIYSAGLVNHGPAGSGTVVLYGNTLYHNGSRGGTDASAVAAGGSVAVSMVNNIVYQDAPATYIASPGLGKLVTGSNNLWHGAGSPPPGFARNVTGDPGFVNAGRRDFHLKTGSPAIGTGLPPTGAGTDLHGNPRPARPSIGAYEVPGGR